MYNEQMCEFEIKDEDVPDKKQGVTINVEFSQRELEAGEDKFLSDWYIHGGILERELFELSSDNKASDAKKEQQKKELLDKIASIKKKRNSKIKKQLLRSKIFNLIIIRVIFITQMKCAIFKVALYKSILNMNK